ncbi:MAG: TetR/AcrR family transcriptional regulator C-terminal domain-containing protein [Chloroflexota bacterium]|nr:TetR/AcrR family transcriptional regulator C-terminal domain-containing protein [Chloroflexota bacterium]
MILDRDGLEALTMRRLARQLGVTPMALYNHVRSKEDILQGVARNLIARTRFASDHPDWRERIRDCYRALRKACLAHPSAVRLMETIEVAPLSLFGPMEVVLAALSDLGMTRDDALRAYCLLTNFTLGQVAYERRGPIQSFNLAAHPDRGKLQEAGLAHVESVALSDGWDFERAFEFGLSTIIIGLERQSSVEPRH